MPLLGDGTRWGVKLAYRSQEYGGGTAECFRIVADDIVGCNVALALGDNIFYGAGVPRLLSRSMAHETGATIFGYEVSDPSAYGVVVLDKDSKPIDLETPFGLGTILFNWPQFGLFHKRTVPFAKRASA